MERYNYELISSGGLRPPQHQVEYKSSSLLIIEFVSLIGAEAGDLRYYIISCDAFQLFQLSLFEQSILGFLLFKSARCLPVSFQIR